MTTKYKKRKRKYRKLTDYQRLQKVNRGMITRALENGEKTVQLVKYKFGTEQEKQDAGYHFINFAIKKGLEPTGHIEGISTKISKNSIKDVLSELNWNVIIQAHKVRSGYVFLPAYHIGTTEEKQEAEKEFSILAGIHGLKIIKTGCYVPFQNIPKPTPIAAEVLPDETNVVVVPPEKAFKKRPLALASIPAVVLPPNTQAVVVPDDKIHKKRRLSRQGLKPSDVRSTVTDTMPEKKHKVSHMLEQENHPSVHNSFASKLGCQYSMPKVGKLHVSYPRVIHPGGDSLDLTLQDEVFSRPLDDQDSENIFREVFFQDSPLRPPNLLTGFECDRKKVKEFLFPPQKDDFESTSYGQPNLLSPEEIFFKSLFQ